MFFDRAAFWQRVQAALQTKSKPRISNIPGWLSPHIKAEARGKARRNHEKPLGTEVTSARSES